MKCSLICVNQGHAGCKTLLQQNPTKNLTAVNFDVLSVPIFAFVMQDKRGCGILTKIMKNTG